jgi:kynureninase
MNFENTLEFARTMDAQDPLRSFRERFIFPESSAKHPVYFTGNSLGLQPKTAQAYVLQELEDWATLGVEGHFHAKRPWYSYHENLTEKIAMLVGAKPIEVCTSHSLTTNLHLLMASFYRPHGKRTKILCEAKAFPSDQYALESQLQIHGIPPDHLVWVSPREHEELIREEDIYDRIQSLGDELALILWGGVNYYTGQYFNLKKITRVGHSVGAMVGFDLAHAAGNVELHLNAWGPDFAAWCGYKYLNSSPGGVSGFFVHERHAYRQNLPRLAGWWGHNKETRFKMAPGFDPIPGAEGWQLSNAPVLGMAVHLASLEVFEEATMDRINTKRDVLTAYLAFVVENSGQSRDHAVFELITPKSPRQRGAQLSIKCLTAGKGLFHALQENGVVADWREPNVIRVAPAPLYNSFEDCFWFGQHLKNAL